MAYCMTQHVKVYFYWQFFSKKFPFEKQMDKFYLSLEINNNSKFKIYLIIILLLKKVNQQYRESYLG